MPAVSSMHGLPSVGCEDEEHRFRSIQVEHSQRQQAPPSQSHPYSVQETLAGKSLLVAPQAAKASHNPSGAPAPSTREQSNWASQSCAGQVPRDQNDRPGSSKAEPGEPSALQATQSLIDHPKKPVLAIEAEAVTGEYHGAWHEARVGQPCGAEVTISTGNLGAARVSANQPWAPQASTIQDKSAPLAPGPAYAVAMARRLMALGRAYRQRSSD
ncbi:hypothetical protein HPB51_007859 [Rhipicephalus microplus]|uniref:Uncharacterized protein n=1 Tax=Rhipicephalus microplus TaxID=6941 RepID=A0A9J6ENM8_RHIMP|nr:hypothetical protein HPB51_007859 [Rhipicephalus microplus]